jgi:hypothetical protein
MELEIIMLSEISHSYKDKHGMSSLISGSWGGVKTKTQGHESKTVTTREVERKEKRGKLELGLKKSNEGW